MITYTACTTAEVESIINNSLRLGMKVTEIAYRFSRNQLAEFIDGNSKKWKEGTVTERHLTKSLICWLINLYREGQSAHYSKICEVTKVDTSHVVTDYSCLKFWHLIRQSNHSGHWEVTPRAERFLQGQLRLCKTVYVKNQVAIRGSDELVTIADFEDLDYTWTPTPKLLEDTTEI